MLLMPDFVDTGSLANFDLIENPVLLVGDCTRVWIDKNAEELNRQLKDIAFGCIYHGKSTMHFSVPYKTSRYSYNLESEAG